MGDATADPAPGRSSPGLHWVGVQWLGKGPPPPGGPWCRKGRRHFAPASRSALRKRAGRALARGPAGVGQASRAPRGFGKTNGGGGGGGRAPSERRGRRAPPRAARRGSARRALCGYGRFRGSWETDRSPACKKARNRGGVGPAPAGARTTAARRAGGQAGGLRGHAVRGQQAGRVLRLGPRGRRGRPPSVDSSEGSSFAGWSSVVVQNSESNSRRQICSPSRFIKAQAWAMAWRQRRARAQEGGPAGGMPTKVWAWAAQAGPGRAQVCGRAPLCYAFAFGRGGKGARRGAQVGRDSACWGVKPQ